MRRLVALLPLLLAGCAQPLGCGAGLVPSVGLTGLFGLDMPGGQRLSPAQWQAFQNAELQPRFPAGFTVSDATGSWRGPDGRITSDPTKVFLVLAPAAQAATARAGLEQAIAVYRRDFQQQSVGLLMQPGCTSGLF